LLYKSSKSSPKIKHAQNYHFIVSQPCSGVASHPYPPQNIILYFFQLHWYVKFQQVYIVPVYKEMQNHYKSGGPSHLILILRKNDVSNYLLEKREKPAHLKPI